MVNTKKYNTPINYQLINYYNHPIEMNSSRNIIPDSNLIHL